MQEGDARGRCKREMQEGDARGRCFALTAAAQLLTLASLSFGSGFKSLLFISPFVLYSYAAELSILLFPSSRRDCTDAIVSSGECDLKNLHKMLHKVTRG
jgi:hypothetical protein